MAVVGERCDRCKTVNATGAPHTCWTRTPEQERADVVAMLQGQIDYWRDNSEPEKARAAAHCMMRVINGEHVGAASKERK